MQKILAVVVFILLPGLCCEIAFAQQTTLEMYLWNRYTLERVAGETKKSEFALKRGYLRLDHKFSENIKGRVNLDFFSSDKDVHGAGTKLKYAYLDFKEVLPIPESKFTFGLQKTYFGTIYDWKYITIQKALEDKEKVISSTDYGITLFGYIPKGFGEYAVSILNGEGYKKTGGEVNIKPAYLANLRVIPIPGVTLGGSVLYEERGTEYDKRLLYAGVVRTAFGPVDIWSEYLVAERGEFNNPTKSVGFMVMPILKLANLTGADVELVARYDKWDKDTDIEDDAHSRVTGGFNWYIQRRAKGKPAVMLQANYERTSYENSGKDPKDNLMVQFRWEFASKPF